MIGKTSKTVLLSTIVAILVFSGILPSVMSTNQINSGWGTNNPIQTYWCSSEINSKLDITSSVSDPCDSMTAAAAMWNNISGSKFSLTESSSQSGSINLWTHPMAGGILAITYGLHTDPFVVADVYIKFSENQPFGDTSQDRDVFSLIRVVGHEFGHTGGVGHHSNRQSIMYELGKLNDINTRVLTHDADILRGLYPQ